jgi:hypothetical protein
LLSFRVALFAGNDPLNPLDGADEFFTFCEFLFFFAWSLWRLSVHLFTIGTENASETQLMETVISGADATINLMWCLGGCDEDGCKGSRQKTVKPQTIIHQPPNKATNPTHQ